MNLHVTQDNNLVYVRRLLLYDNIKCTNNDICLVVSKLGR